MHIRFIMFLLEFKCKMMKDHSLFFYKYEQFLFIFSFRTNYNLIGVLRQKGRFMLDYFLVS